MTIQELYAKLCELNIPSEKYYLQGIYGSDNDEDKLALIIKKGKYFLEYEIYYKERGEKQLIKKFTDEEDAYQYFYRRLKEDKEIQDKYFRK